MGLCGVACSAVIQKEDDEGILGVKIGKELMSVAGRALTANIMRLGPKVLPISEQLIFAGNLVARKVVEAPWPTSTVFSRLRLMCYGWLGCRYQMLESSYLFTVELTRCESRLGLRTLPIS